MNLDPAGSHRRWAILEVEAAPAGDALINRAATGLLAHSLRLLRRTDVASRGDPRTRFPGAASRQYPLRHSEREGAPVRGQNSGQRRRGDLPLPAGEECPPQGAKGHPQGGVGRDGEEPRLRLGSALLLPAPVRGPGGATAALLGAAAAGGPGPGGGGSGGDGCATSQSAQEDPAGGGGGAAHAGSGPQAEGSHGAAVEPGAQPQGVRLPEGGAALQSW